MTAVTAYLQSLRRLSQLLVGGLLELDLTGVHEPDDGGHGLRSEVGGHVNGAVLHLALLLNLGEEISTGVEDEFVNLDLSILRGEPEGEETAS